MEAVFPALLLAAVVLACPVTMGAMGLGVWLWSRAKGEKKEFSMGCMGGKCDHQEHAAQDDPGTLKEQVARLQQEVSSLRAQTGSPAAVDIGTHAAQGPNGRKTAKDAISSAQEG